MIKVYYSFIKKENSHDFLEYVLRQIYKIEGEILKSENGKPYIAGSKYHFNLSHSGEIVMLAVSDKPIGIDVERIEQRDYEKFCKRFFSLEEQKRVNSLLSFYVLWTKKESFVKYLGGSVADVCETEFTDKIRFKGEEQSVFSVSEKMDDYVFSVCSDECEYEKILIM